MCQLIRPCDTSQQREYDTIEGVIDELTEKSQELVESFQS